TYLTGDDEISGFYESCDIVAEPEETTWQPEDTGDIMNQEFQMYTVEEEDREYYYGVIAVSKTGTSMVSPLIPKKEMAKKLPFCEEENRYEGEFGVTRFAQSIDLLSRYQWIQLCDGTMAQRLLQYKIDDAELVNVDDGDGVKEMLQLPYTVVGTEFEGSFYVETFDRKTYQEDLENLQKRQDILKSKMTGLLRDVEVEVRPERSTDEDIRENQDVPAAGKHSNGDGLEEGLENMLDNPMGTTKLSCYLSACLLERDEYIAVSDIQEIPDREGLMDAFYEAYYQNPLIPAVREISVLESGEALSVVYEEDVETGRKKQRQVMEQVEFVTRELEEEGMTDLDKVLAVNSYLCDTVTYDTMSPIEAGQNLMTCAGTSELHYGEAMAGQSADEVFTDSMTPFGALVNHRGVCLAYAGAFQLLARAMGLDSIVVTGTLNGNQNHAWNKVKIDGKWCVVDVTSNDDQDMGNSMLNVSDKMAELVLKENDHYLCDDSIGQYIADTDEFEYYHLSGKDYEKDKIAEAFVHELTLGKKAVLRTDATLTNAEFQSIVKEVMDDMDQIEMQGYYRLGVVYLER
ncbi:MAG: transglutaminase-like domain-containing protein, partial [Lachnospiraceae bacterium]|nr:transglutaminase-like domain-containing protein [Lachnospiraceae bacterium]